MNGICLLEILICTAHRHNYLVNSPDLVFDFFVSKFRTLSSIILTKLINFENRISNVLHDIPKGKPQPLRLF